MRIFVQNFVTIHAGFPEDWYVQQNKNEYNLSHVSSNIATRMPLVLEE